MKQKKKSEPLKPCPSKDVIHVMQFQFFDNGPKGGRGAAQHTMMLEAYCEGRLNLFNPYWKRTVQLADPKLAIRWADKKLAEGEMTAEQHAVYADAYEVTKVLAADDEIEWVKIGHIGSKRENKRYVGQFVLVSRQKDGPMQCVVFLDGESLVAGRFQHDRHWKPGGKRRKAYAFYDPAGLYDAMKREEAQRAAADAKGAERTPEASGGDAESILAQSGWTL